MLDLVIKNAIVIDGTGNPRVRADVGVAGDRIAEVGTIDESVAAQVFDAQGHVVTPGFIDPHSHSDFTLHSNPHASSTVRQGVTTEIVGNCGMSNAPVSDASRAGVEQHMRAFGFDGEVEWSSFGEYLDSVRRVGTSRNVAFLVGASALRAAAGAWRTSDEDQRKQMIRDVEEAMNAGALGMSSGLEYGYGRFTTTDELSEVAAVVGQLGGIYASHIRNRDARLLPAVEEFVDVIRATGARGQVSHLNVRTNTGAEPGAWDRAVGMLVAAREQGLDIETDMTPFREGLGMMIGVLPESLLANGLAAAADELKDPSVRRELRTQCDRYWRFVHRGEWDRVRLLNSAEFPDYNGKSFPEIAALHGKDEWDCFFDILQAAGGAMGALTLVGVLFTEEHLEANIQHPLFSLGVDSYASAVELHGHVPDSPLSYCGHVHYLAHHVRELHSLTLEEAVRKMTSMPASRFGLRGRGVVQRGSYADLVVFDPTTVASSSNFAEPAVYPTGIDLVVVNGAVVVDSNGQSDALPGRVLRNGE